MEDFDIKAELQCIIEWLAGEYTAIRTGQATPGLLDSVKVESYGSMMPLNQVGNVGVEDARTLRIAPWDISQIQAIETALQEADLGLSVATDSAGVRAIFPELTAERRAQLEKLAKSKLEDARIRVRGVRDEVMKAVEKSNKAGDLSDDEAYDHKERIQTAVETCNKSLEELYNKKQTELTV